MGKYYVIGRAGTGKSSVAAELHRRGHLALDGDAIEGLCSWQNLHSGEQVSLDASSYVDINKFGWMIDGERLLKVLRQYDSVFICVGANNELAFTDCFDQCFVLDVTAEEHTRRLQTRSNNSYGRHPAMIPGIIAWQERLLAEATSLGYVAVNANQPIQSVVDTILSEIRP